MKAQLENRHGISFDTEIAVCKVGGAPREGREVCLILANERLYLTRRAAQTLASALLSVAPILEEA